MSRLRLQLLQPMVFASSALVNGRLAAVAMLLVPPTQYPLVRRQPAVSRSVERIVIPDTIYDLGYLPLDRELARRLDWLVSEYLGLENFQASNELMALIAEIE